MRKIIKSGTEPHSLTSWKRNNPNKRYHEISDANVRQEMREAALKEQFYLCGYCCESLNDHTECVNEHVEARDIGSNRTLDFVSNIIASCKTPHQCDDAHKSQPLPLTPLMDECETELKFKPSGRVEGLSQRAKDAISVLNLGDHERHNKRLIEKRKQLVDSILFSEGISGVEELMLEEDDLLELLLDDLMSEQNERSPAFAPVLANILRQSLFGSGEL